MPGVLLPLVHLMLKLPAQPEQPVTVILQAAPQAMLRQPALPAVRLQPVLLVTPAAYWGITPVQ